MEWSAAKGRGRLAYCMAVTACVLGFCVHALIWGWSMGLGNLLRPDYLLQMLGPALVPTLVAGFLISLSKTFDSWFWVQGSALLVLVIETIIFWIWATGLEGSMGFEIFLLMPILGGFPLALISYHVAHAWTAR